MKLAGDFTAFNGKDFYGADEFFFESNFDWAVFCKRWRLLKFQDDKIFVDVGNFRRQRFVLLFDGFRFFLLVFVFGAPGFEYRWE